MARRKAILTDSSENNAHQSLDDKGPDVMETAQRIVRRTKNTREDKRRSIQDDYQKRANELSTRIDEHFEGHKLKVNKAQSNTWDRLDALNKNRQRIEGLILNSTKILESATLNMTSELMSILRDSIYDHQAVMLRDPEE